MKIKVNNENKKCVLSLEGRLDTTTAPELSNELDKLYEDITDLTLDFEKLEYISSAGLRALLLTQRTMEEKAGSFKVKNVCKEVLDVFEITGFAEMLIIE